MKIEVGMYVRFYDGDIGKIARYEYSEEYSNGHTIQLEGEEIGWCCEERDFKVSNNIIDLIEVGDYVNGKKVIKVNIDYIFDYSEEIKIVYFNEEDYIYSSSDIKSIVTKEQFESISYKVGE